MFTREQKERWDWNSIIYTAQREGRDEGLAIGEKRGEKRGEMRGEKRGEKIGEKRGEKRGEMLVIRKAAKALLANNVSIETIIKCTGLSIKEIKAL